MTVVGGLLPPAPSPPLVGATAGGGTNIRGAFRGLEVKHPDSRFVARSVIALILTCISFWVILGVSIAYASSPLEVGSPEANAKRSGGTEYEPSATSATIVYLACQSSGFKAGSAQFFVKDGGVELWAPEVKETTETKSNYNIPETFIVAAGKKWTWNTVSGTWACESTYQAVAGGEGKEGKEGKPGAEGKEGKPGAEGKEGMGAVKLTSFSSEAQETLSELKESMETVGWCIIGTMLALSLGFWVTKLLKVTR